MNSLTTIDLAALSTVCGGEDTQLGGRFKTPATDTQLNYSSKGTPERRNDFNTCMNDRQAKCGWFQSPQSCQSMALEACTGLVGSPQNPQSE